MQNTRLSTIVSTSVGQISQWSRNPWRRTSLILISLLVGFFLASVISTISGAKSEQDISTAAITLFIVEMINRYVYTLKRVTPSDNNAAPRLLTKEILNSLKLGLVYGLFLEAFKLGS
ncbi:hypothetical protein B9G53_03745 [Pseudanabaena sp. SR411]|uniref:DUF565 domain-containing protein n=1 Tax=Pseudanabaena sp. SR411 TaxID=1980935 RepID=UPI000B992A99|nr:DUF565 domain-containing protein [Pseudanabaena sp. SR411]OYQ66575.1 hypothetical protein B9G53_03745 [Pseudanabaena sp. SR411]